MKIYAQDQSEAAGRSARDSSDACGSSNSQVSPRIGRGSRQECCHITISRFFRDRRVFETLRNHVLPELAQCAERERRTVHIWSAGCGSGEEPYTIKILWDLEVASSRPGISLSVLATDVDVNMLARAQKACFEATSL